MKILMLGWELPPYNSGGLGVACYELCKHLAHQGVDIEFILPYTADHSDIDFMKINPAHPQDALTVMQAGIAYDSYRYTTTYTDGSTKELDLFGQEELFQANVERLARLGEYDVIHAHDWLTFRAALRAKRVSGKPLIVHVHATEYDRSAGNHGNPFVREIEEMAMRLADRVVAVSEVTKQILVKQYGIPADKIEVVHNSITIDRDEEYGTENLFRYLTIMKQHGYRVVVNIGRLTIQKNLVNFLHAAKEVVRRNNKALFLIVGSGEQYRELLELSADLGIANNVIFTEFLRGKKVRDAFKIGDLFVMPSVSEPFGLTPLEAIGFGTPALISKQSGVSEVVQNVLKVDFWDVDEMANKIDAVLKHDVLRDELLKNSAHELTKMSWHHSANSMRRIYGHHVGALA